MLAFHDLGHGITCIETHFHRTGLAGCYLVQSGDQAALIDTGTAHTVPDILELLALRGIEPSQVRYVIPTHVHLDHAGGAGQLMSALPTAQLLIHPQGAPHLINPEKIAAGSKSVYGDEKFRENFKEILPVAAERVIAVEDGSQVNLNGRVLTCIHSAGHARHHICIWDETSGGMFTGDTFGLAYPELTTEQGPFMVLPSTPVQFDPEVWHRTLDHLMTFNPTRIYLTHYCAIDHPKLLVAALHEELDAYPEIARSCENTENRLPALEAALWTYYRKRLDEHGCSLSHQEQEHILGMDMELCAQGLEVWLQRSRKAV
ncbi:MAG: MBL fold metallo-hydrolase [Gammaproteobacteria bacterium]|nr:MBL fold metallo-hydrolase [Gammaproteobacteria bacterium]